MNKHTGKGIYTFLFYKTLLALCTVTTMQVVFYFCNTRIFHIDGFEEFIGIVWGNVIFGLATVFLFLFPYFLLMLLPVKWRWKKWYRIIAEIFYILPILAIIVARGSNSAYYQYTYRLLSDEIFSYLGISGQMDSLLPLFAVDYWYAWVFPLVVFGVFLFFNFRLRIGNRTRRSVALSNDIVGFCIGMLLVWFFVRGGFGHFLQTTDAAHYCQPKNTALVNNDAYNIARTIGQPHIVKVDYMSDDDANALFSPLSAHYSETVSDSTMARNVVLIIIESMGQEFMGCYNDSLKRSHTPFLDSLARLSTVYQGRSNGKKSIEGITALTCGIPTLMSIPFTNSEYADNRFEGIPTILKRHGYHTAFFHGSYNGVMDFDKTCQKIGFDEYIGKDEYDDDCSDGGINYDGVWGIFDEPFLQYTARYITGYNEPFFAEIFTVTSHHPFPIPQQYKDVFIEQEHPILKCIEYTDYSLQKFFERVKSEPWYNNTLFIITGDHSGHGLTREYNDYDGWYRIPFIVFDPQNQQGKVEQRIVQQTDLLPSLIDMLGINDTTFSFGQSIMQKPNCGWQVYYGNNYYCMVSNNALNPSQHDITIIAGDKEYGSANNLRFLKAVIQQYSNCILNDKISSR
ncbi:MAG: LTA synthase family protein [Bacteroidales bacterium]|nr:LTA synthase family protein [Bacteroidales bacterium]